METVVGFTAIAVALLIVLVRLAPLLVLVCSVVVFSKVLLVSLK